MCGNAAERIAPAPRDAGDAAGTARLIPERQPHFCLLITLCVCNFHRISEGGGGDGGTDSQEVEERQIERERERERRRLGK